MTGSGVLVRLELILSPRAHSGSSQLRSYALLRAASSAERVGYYCIASEAGKNKLSPLRKPQSFALAKEIIAGFAGAEVDKMIETKGTCFRMRGIDPSPAPVRL